MVTPRLGAEAETFLRANPDVQSVQVIWTDLCGVIRGKVLRRELARHYQERQRDTARTA